MVETGSTKFVACSEDYTLGISCEQESSLNEANNGFIGLYEEALNHDLGSIDEDWFNSCFEHCNSECSRFVLEYETSKDELLATSQQHSSNEYNVFSNCEMHYPAGRGLQTGNCRDRVQDSFIKQGNENLESNHIGEDPTTILFIEQNNENLESNNNGEVFTNADASELEFYNLLQENIPREIEHNQDQTMMPDEGDCPSIKEKDKKCNDSSIVCLNVQDFTCNDSVEEQSTSHILEKFSPNFTVLESPVNLIKTPTFKNVTPLTGNIYRVRKTSCLSSQLLKWSPITQTDTDQSSPRIFPLYQSPLSMTIRSSTPCNITQSLGVQICGKDLEWNSAMETPLVAEIGPKCKEGDTRKKTVHVAAQFKAIPRTLFTEDELHAEEEIATSVNSPANSLMLNCEEQFHQTNNNIKEQSNGSSSLHCVVDNLMYATSLISEPKIKSNAIDQNIVSTLKDLVSSQEIFNCVETSPNSFNVGEYSCINEEKNQEATFRNYADSFSVSDKCYTTAFDCIEQSHLSAASVQNALSFLFAKESNMTLRHKENEENSVSFQHVELDKNIVSTPNHSETADISLQLVEDSKSATNKSEQLHLESVMFPLHSLESNKMCKFSGFHYASGKSININQQSLKQIEFMWRKVKDDPWTCIKDNTMQLFQNCDTVENKVLKPATSTTGLEQVDSNIINNNIVSSPNQCHEASLESQLVEIAPDSDTLLEEKDTRICTDNKNMTMQAEISSEINSFEKSSILNSQFHLCSFSKPKRSLDNDVLNKEYGNESQSYLIDIPLTQMLEVAESTYVCLKEMEEGSSQLQISPRINTKINSSINTNFNHNKNSHDSFFQKSEVSRQRKTIVSTNLATRISSNNEYPQNELLSGMEDSDSANDTSNVVQAMYFSSPKCQEDKIKKKPNNISNGKKHEASTSSMKQSKCVENHNGFTTASGKLIKISSSSLLKSRQVFADLDAKIAKEKSSADNTVLNDYLYNIKNCPVVSDKNCFNNECKVDIKCNVKNDTMSDISDNGSDKVTSCETNSEVNELSCNVNKGDVPLKECSEECVLQRNEGYIKCLTDELNEKDPILYKNDDYFQANSLQKPELAYTNYILSGTNNLEIAPVFYTAAGKKVAVSEHSLKKAKVLLGKENSTLEEETNNARITNSEKSLDNDKLEEVTEYVPSFDMGNFMACSQENNTLLDSSDEKYFVNCCEYNDTDFVDKCNVNDLVLVQDGDERNTSKLKIETKRLEDSELAENDCVNQCESRVVSFQTIHNSDKTEILSTVLEKNVTLQRQGLGDNVQCKIFTDNHEENWHATHTTESFTTNHANSYINKIASHTNTETEVNNLSLKDDGNLTKDKAHDVIHINIENQTKSISPQIKQSNHYTRQSDRLLKNTNRKFTEKLYNEGSDIKNNFCEQIPFSEFFTNAENMNTTSKQATMDTVNDPAAEMVGSVINEFHNLDQHCNSTTERLLCDSINYVGFATASGKKVEISAKCLLKAKQLFSSVDKNYKTENVAYPEQSTKDITDKSHKTVQENDSQSLHTKFIGFTTASGKKVDVLAESLSKAKMVLGSINENFCTADEKRKFESHTKNQSDMLNIRAFNININNKDVSTMDYLNQSMESQIPHSVSKEMICTETVENLKNLQKTSKDTVIIQQPQIKNSDETESSILVTNNRSEMIQSAKNSNGSSNKVLNIRDINQLSESEVSEHNTLMNQSKKPINKALCENDKCKKLKENLTNITKINCFSFNTASGNKVTVSKRALEAAKKVLDDNDSKKKCLDFNKNCVDIQAEYEEKFPKYLIKEESVSSGGFYTATGKQVTVSNDSLEVAKTLLNNTSINSLEKCKNLGDTKGNDGFSVEDQIQHQKPVGFTTASGKELHILEQSLKHVKQLFQNCEKEFAACKSNVSSDDISSCIAVNSEISESSLCNKFNNTVPNEFPINQLEMKNVYTNCRASTSLTSAEITKDSNTSCNSELIFPFNKQHYRNKTSSKRTNKEIIIESRHQKRCRTDEYGQESISVRKNGMPSYCVSYVEEIRRSARKSQEERIKNKSATKVPVLPGSLWHKKMGNNTRRGLKEIVGGMLPGSAKNKFSAEEMQTILSATLSSLKQFVFKPSNYFDAEIYNNSSEIKIADRMIVIINDKNEIRFDELCRAFLDGPGVDPNLVNHRWIKNHYSWIVWKLAAMEVSFPSVFGKQCLTPENVLLQLKYRYDREIDNAQRSALKKIMEQDDTPTKTMVLCIAGINSIQSAKKEALDRSTDCEKCLLLTDGWYSIPASVDNAMKHLIKNGKIALGQKIIVSDAELIGSDIPCSPLEAPPELMLKVSTNSIRRARWDIKLGFFQSPKPFPVSFSSVFSDGGFVGCVDCVVQRVYPLLYMEKYPTGNIAFHNERVESKAADNYLKSREYQLEKLAESVQKEFEALIQEKENKKERKKRQSYELNQLGFQELNTGEEIYEAVDTLAEFGTIEMDLNTQQKCLLIDYKSKLQSEQREQLEKMMNKSINEAMEENKIAHERISIPLLKVLLMGISEADREKHGTCLLTVWRPSEKALQYLREGCCIRIYHLTPGTARKWKNQISLNSTKRTDYEDKPVDHHIIESCFIPRKVSQFMEINGESAFGEVDVVGVVVSVVSSLPELCAQLQIVYISDYEMKFLAVKFLKGISHLGMEEILQPGKIVAASNLSVEQHYNCHIPTVVASELSYFTCCPKSPLLQSVLKEIQISIKNIPDFLTEAQNILKKIQCKQLYSPLIARSFQPNLASPMIRADKEIFSAQGVKRQFGSSRKKLYPVYSPLCLQTKSPLCPTIEQIPHTPKHTPSPHTVLDTGTISPAERRSHEIKDKISKLSKYGSAPPLPILTSPASASTKKPFFTPYVKQDTTPLTTKRRGIRQWRGKTLPDSNENILGKCNL